MGRKMASLPGPGRDGESVTTSIRKIENGYLVDSSRYSPDGGYQSRTVYSKDKPVLAAESNGAEDMPPSSLKKAIGKLGSFR